MLASIFLFGGLDALRHPESKAPAAQQLLGDHAQDVPLVQTSSQLVRLDAAVKIGAGLALSLNRAPRLAALALAASLVPTTLAGHRFWDETDPKQRAAAQIHFAKNASILGGLLLASVDTEGRPSAGWRTRRAIADAAHTVAESGAAANHALSSGAHVLGMAARR